MHHAPTELPGYTAVERLYTGARSTVYRARASGDGRRVILKLATRSASRCSSC